ncbi:phosphoribosylglycinamide formyltransferase, partial [Francisella tularensis subsp. holarctica]|uniref:formyltransferase family protein n=1 Tax=Francisella tularensis TaxID=263 RepID=UPI002381970B
MSKLNIVILGSTRGTNMQAIIDAIENKQLNAQISLVISNKSDAYILQISAASNIPTKYIAAKGLTREQYDD